MIYTATIEAANEDGDLYMILPDDLVKELGWEIGDLLNWHIEGNTVILSRKEVTEND